MSGEEDEEEHPASLWLHPLTALLYAYIHHAHLEDPEYVLLLPYYCATCQIHDRFQLQRGDGKNTKSFFHALQSCKRRGSRMRAVNRKRKDVHGFMGDRGVGREDQKGICRGKTTQGLDSGIEMSEFFFICVDQGTQGGNTKGQTDGVFSLKEAVPFPEVGQQLRKYFCPNVFILL